MPSQPTEPRYVRKDGTQVRAPNNARKLTTFYLRGLKPQPQPFLVWDPETNGLAIQVRPNGSRSWKFIYSQHKRVRWFHIGDGRAMSLEEARVRARKLRVQVDDGKDPQALKQAKLSAGTLEDVAGRYREHAKTKNKSWEQGDYLVRKYLLPRFGKLPVTAITHDHIEQLKNGIAAPVMANQVLAATSAIFSWAIKARIAGVSVNPCHGVERHEVTSRERVLSDGELRKFWPAFEEAGVAGRALQLILLLGQRPGEVSHLRSEHVVDGWWELLGKPVPALGWPGTKNGENHRVWLPGPARAVLAKLEPQSGYVLADGHGRPVERLDAVMRKLCRELGVSSKVTPHDLRRTHGTRITGLGFGREAMNRVQNHKEGGIGGVYDRYSYADENKRVMATVADHIMAIVDSRDPAGNVIGLRRSA
jgi:integrase